MNRMLVCLLLTLALLLGVASAPLAAQDAYTIQKGDSAWRVAGNVWDNPILWREVVKKNPILQQEGRITINPKNGWTYVMMHPGEQLFGLQELGITAPTPTPLSQLGIKIPDPVVVHEIPAWAWWPLGLALLILIAIWIIYRMLTRDPVNSRSAMVPGGVTEVNAAIAMQQVAARTSGQDNPSSRLTAVYQQFTVIRQTAGRIWGVMTVRYADGRSVPRQLHGERAYEAEVRFPNGHTETLYMLQGCGNDLRMGGISRYLPGPDFRFEADPVIATPPAPTTPTAHTGGQGGSGLPDNPIPTPAPAPATEAQAPTPASQDGLTFEMKRSSDGRPHLIRFDSDQVEECIVGRDRRITVRYREVNPTK